MDTVVFEVSLGTMDMDVKKKCYDKLQDDLARVTKLPVWQALVTGYCAKLAQEDTPERPIFTIPEALEKAKEEGVKTIKVIMVHMTKGAEYYKIKEEVEEFCSKNKIRLQVAESVFYNRDACAFVAGIIAQIVTIEPDRDYVVVGHGNSSFPGIAYEYMTNVFHSFGYNNVFVAQVISTPGINETLEFLKEQNENSETKRPITVIPLLVASGHYMMDDIVGYKPDSFISGLREAGYTAERFPQDLGEFPQFRQIYCSRVLALKD